jgi:hypothetical protein
MWGCLIRLSGKLDWRAKALTHVVGFLYPLTGFTRNVTPAMSFNDRRTQIIIGITAGIFGLVVFFYHQDQKEKEWACLQRIEYSPSSNFYRLNKEKRFKSQNEAIEYCLAALSNEPSLALQIPSSTMEYKSGDEVSEGESAQLPEARRQQLDDIVMQMTTDNAPEEDIQAVVDDFKLKYKSDDSQIVFNNQVGLWEALFLSLRDIVASIVLFIVEVK